MTKFKIPKRYDSTLANDGVWFELYDEYNNLWGSFKCGYADRSGPRWKVTFERLQREYKNFRKVPNLDVVAFVELALLDWKMEDENDAPIPFSKDEAVKYFTDPETVFAFDKLAEFSNDVRNFQSDPPVASDGSKVEAHPKKG